MIILLFVLVTVIAVGGGIAAHVAQTCMLTRDRGNMVSALQYAQGAAVIACSELNAATVNSNGVAMTTYLKNGTNYGIGVYTAVSTTTYQRTISAPFSNQTATVQIVLGDASGSPKAAQIIASATVGGSTQTATVNVKMGWAYPAAIVSVNAGTSETGNGKGVGQDGNVAIDGANTGPMIINGGTGLAVLANGRVNYDTNYLNPPASAYSQTNWGKASQIADYTAQGTANALFDLNRFIAIADSTPGGYSPSGNNHFTNVSDFMIAANTYSNPFTKSMQGVIVVDVSQSDISTLSDSAYSQKTTIVAAKTDKKTGITTPGYTNTVATGGLPFGINVTGTLLLNFTGSGWDPVNEKFVCDTPLNVNAANLSGLVATNPATYTTGYPPAFTDSTKNPINIDISSLGYANFNAGDDLPAVIYSTGCLDTHNSVDVCGVFYTPCYIELENQHDGDIQYINGCVIMGHGIYYQNNKKATSIISFDANTVDSLTTFGAAGKSVAATYWQP